MVGHKSKKRFLVIGGAGFIGSNLVRFLAQKGNEVIVFDRKALNLDDLEGLPIKLMLGDLLDENNLYPSLLTAMEGCEGIFNAATIMSPLKRHRHIREVVNINAARIVARIARKAGNIRLVHLSSTSAIAKPEDQEIIDERYPFNFHDSHYALTKYLGDQAVLDEVKRGLDAVIANLGSTIGYYNMVPHQYHLFKSIAEGRALFYPPGGLCLMDTDSAVRGLSLCYEKGLTGRRYIIGGNNISYRQYFNEVANATGGKSPRFCLPGTMLPLLGFLVETIYNFMKIETKITKSVAELLCKNSFYSSALAKKELGYTITDWKEAIRVTVTQKRLCRGV